LDLGAFGQLQLAEITRFIGIILVIVF